MTSAHNQWASGIPSAGDPCPNTTRGVAGTGNEPSFSYAFRVFHGAAKFAGGNYYNYARTGYTTGDMRFATNATTDACANRWGKGASPFGMVLATAGWEKSQQRKVAWVTTGGVNNTNWSTMLGEFVMCSMAQSAWRYSTGMTITPNGGAAHRLNGSNQDMLALDQLLARGGSCTFSFPFAGSTTVNVPAFDLPTTGPGITADVSAMVAGAVAAKLDRIIWVGYYDISPAVVEVPGMIRATLTARGWNATMIELLINRLARSGFPATFPISRNAAQTTTLRTNLTALNTAICSGVAAGQRGAPAGAVTCTTWPMAGFSVPGDIQRTVKGGMPHPSSAGHGKLATMVLRII